MPHDPSPFGRTLFGAEHVHAYQETGGEQGYEWRGTTVLLLTTIGRRSREPRTTPLIFRSDGDGRWVVIASKGGAPDHPDWFKNVVADPDVTVQIKDEVIQARAHEAEGEERERLWQMMAEIWPPYDSYQQRTDRRIPVVVLERRSGEAQPPP
jgi:deazaflavin-dependent oxidoreductase (nitroreductase family)